MDDGVKRQAEIIAGEMNCPENFVCLTEEFQSSHAEIIRASLKLPDFAICLRNEKKWCNYLITHRSGRYCKCKVRVYMSNVHGK
jgi:hypothetical protein